MVSNWNLVWIFKDIPSPYSLLRIQSIPIIRRVNTAANATSKTVAFPFLENLLFASGSFGMIERSSSLNIGVIFIFGWSMIKNEERFIVKFKM